VVRMDCMPMSRRSVGLLLDLYQKIVRFGLKMTEFEPRMRILPASIERSGNYSRHAHNTLEQLLKCTIVLSTCVPFGAAKNGQTAILRRVDCEIVGKLDHCRTSATGSADTKAGGVAHRQARTPDPGAVPSRRLVI